MYREATAARREMEIRMNATHPNSEKHPSGYRIRMTTNGAWVSVEVEKTADRSITRTMYRRDDGATDAEVLQAVRELFHGTHIETVDIPKAILTARRKIAATLVQAMPGAE